MKISSIKETCLYIQSIEKTERFYHGLLGLPVKSKKEENHIFFIAGNSMLLCFIKEVSADQANLPPHYAKGSIHFAFEVMKEDYDAWKEKISGAGIAIEHEEEWRDGLKSFYFRDPDGHLAEILQPGIWD
jgi:catechol 2,3-dioxygenase-like lactoylglutathione lyase family enzyme